MGLLGQGALAIASRILAPRALGLVSLTPQQRSNLDNLIPSTDNTFFQNSFTAAHSQARIPVGPEQTRSLLPPRCLCHWPFDIPVRSPSDARSDPAKPSALATLAPALGEILPSVQKTLAGAWSWAAGLCALALGSLDTGGGAWADRGRGRAAWLPGLTRQKNVRGGAGAGAGPQPPARPYLAWTSGL
jgi:hypothetical protein